MAASREAVASRPSTGGGIEGGSSIEAEHMVLGEEGGVEGGDDVGVGNDVEAGKRQRRRRRGQD
jgi:hypothetical protein